MAANIANLTMKWGRIGSAPMSLDYQVMTSSLFRKAQSCKKYPSKNCMILLENSPRIATAKLPTTTDDTDTGISDLDAKVRIELTDIDYLCVKMAFINMSILGLSARIIWGNVSYWPDRREF